MQAVNMGHQLLFTRPPTEVETQHLVGALGGCPPDPQADQQTGDDRHIDLDRHPIRPLAEQVPAAQHTFHPAKKHLDVIVSTVVSSWFEVNPTATLECIAKIFPCKNGSFTGASDQGHECLKCPQLVVLQSMFM